MPSQALMSSGLAGMTRRCGARHEQNWVRSVNSDLAFRFCCCFLDACAREVILYLLDFPYGFRFHFYFILSLRVDWIIATIAASVTNVP